MMDSSGRIHMLEEMEAEALSKALRLEPCPVCDGPAPEGKKEHDHE